VPSDKLNSLKKQLRERVHASDDDDAAADDDNFYQVVFMRYLGERKAVNMLYLA